MLLPLLSRTLTLSRSTATSSLRTMSTIPVPKTKATTYASRLQTGRALALDVWSVFKYVDSNLRPLAARAHAYQPAELARGLHQSRPGLYELRAAPVGQGRSQRRTRHGRSQPLLAPARSHTPS